MEESSIIPAHPGVSYNPDFDAYQSLLREEVERAEKEKAVRNKYFRKCQPAPEGKSENIPKKQNKFILFF